MIINKYITIDKISNCNKYHCDISKPYFISRSPHNYSSAYALGVFIATISFFGFIIGLIRRDDDVMIVCSIVFAISIIIAIIYYYLERKRKASDKLMLSKSIISLGTIVSIKSKVIAVLKLDDSFEIIEYAIEEPTTKVNDRIAIIKTSKRPIVILRCTLIAI